MRGLLKQLGCGGQFDNAAEIHHGHIVADMAHHRQVMRDENHRHVALLAQRHEQVKDLRLDRHIQRRDRFVSDQQPRLQRQSPGDSHPLTLSA